MMNISELQLVQRQRTMSVSSNSSAIPDAKALSAQTSLVDDSIPHEEDDPADITDVKGATLIEKEVAETGSVGMKVYGYYMKNIGVTGVLLGVAMQLIYQVQSQHTFIYLVNMVLMATFVVLAFR